MRRGSGPTGRPAVVSVVDAVAQDLRAQLFRGWLAGGLSVTEAAVAGRYEVARSTAKAAIERLVTEGLLVRGANCSARSRVLDVEDVRDLCRTWADLEGIALRRLATRAPDRPEVLVDHRPTGVRDEPVLLDVAEADLRFHTRLLDAAGSARLAGAFRAVADEVRLCVAQVRVPVPGGPLAVFATVRDEHSRLLRRVRAGDGDGAVDALDRHVGEVRDELVRALTGVQVGGPVRV